MSKYANRGKETLPNGGSREHSNTYYSGLRWATRSTDQSYQQLGRCSQTFPCTDAGNKVFLGAGTVAMREASEACTFFAVHNSIMHALT